MCWQTKQALLVDVVAIVASYPSWMTEAHSHHLDDENDADGYDDQ